MPKIGRTRRTTKNADGDVWRRRAEAYERLVHMVRLAEQYLDADGESVYGLDHPMRELHEALLILNDYKVIKVNRDLRGVDPHALWKAVDQWKRSADGIEAIDRAAEQIRDPWGWPPAPETPWPPLEAVACDCGVWKRPRAHGENVLHADWCAIRNKPDPTDEDI